jgi:hypothetical protein
MGTTPRIPRELSVTRLLPTLLVVVFIASAAAAYGAPAPPAQNEGRLTVPIAPQPSEEAATTIDFDVLPAQPAESVSERPSAAFSFLYATNAALQSFDAYSTLKALDGRGVERNPLMTPVVRSPAGFLAVKISAATVAIVAAEQLRKRDHRLAALLLMLGSNSFMACVAINNARVLATR